MVKEDYVEFSVNQIKPFENCRMLGEDLRLGEIVLPKGRTLKASDLGLLPPWVSL
jgi:molybdopterin molybdotransferase